MAVIPQGLRAYIQKYRYAAIILLCGIVLMMLPSGEKKTAQEPAVSETVVSEDTGLQESLETILSQVSGAGKVRVLLSEEAGEEVLYQEDVSESGEGASGSLRQETVTITGSDRAEQGLIRQKRAPVYRGAVIICQGADNASVRLAVVEAVSSVTGLASNRITVLKMK